MKSEMLCRQCHLPTEPYGHGRLLTLRHLPIFGHEVYIQIKPARGICKHCDDHPTDEKDDLLFEVRSHA